MPRVITIRSQFSFRTKFHDGRRGIADDQMKITGTLASASISRAAAVSPDATSSLVNRHRCPQVRRGVFVCVLEDGRRPAFGDRCLAARELQLDPPWNQRHGLFSVLAPATRVELCLPGYRRFSTRRIRHRSITGTLIATPRVLIESWALESPQASRFHITAHLAEMPPEDPTGLVAEAIRNYFNYKAEPVPARGDGSAAGGANEPDDRSRFLSTCHIVADLLTLLAGGTFLKILRESLTIGGWVAMWRPNMGFAPSHTAPPTSASVAHRPNRGYTSGFHTPDTSYVRSWSICVQPPFWPRKRRIYGQPLPTSRCRDFFHVRVIVSRAAIVRLLHRRESMSLKSVGWPAYFAALPYLVANRTATSTSTNAPSRPLSGTLIDDRSWPIAPVDEPGLNGRFRDCTVHAAAPSSG